MNALILDSKRRLRLERDNEHLAVKLANYYVRLGEEYFGELQQLADHFPTNSLISDCLIGLYVRNIIVDPRVDPLTSAMIPTAMIPLASDDPFGAPDSLDPFASPF